MPAITQRILMLEAPRQARFVARPLASAGPADVVVRPLCSTFKHGTEMMAYLGRGPHTTRTFDPRLRLFEPAAAETFYPRPMGSMMVGTVLEAGAEVRQLRPGQSVYAWAPIADIHVISADKAIPLGPLTPEQALCVDPASFALGGVLDGAIAASETVLVTGLGAIGLFAVQYARARGATVLAASSFPQRRALAAAFGAAEAYDPSAHADLARHIKERRGGVHAAIECSGSLANLNLAMRAARQCGRVVCVGFYGPADSSLDLGAEFFHNRLTLLASLPALSWNNPVRSERPLYAKDLQALVTRDFADGTITPEGILAPAVSFAEAEEAVRWIAESPERVVKVLVKHD